MTHAHNPAAPEGATGILVLADGTIIWGRGFGATGSAVGEVCFNTAMTGYQEVMTDPSYAGQIVTFTFPHIGNVGTNEEDIEADNPHALGCIVREDITAPSNFRDQKPFDQWMAEQGRIGISGVDTRALTRRIREAGAPNAVIAHDPEGQFDIDDLLGKARAWSGLEGLDLAKEVTGHQTHLWDKGGAWRLGHGYAPLEELEASSTRPHVVAIDYGAKRNIFRNLVKAGAKVTVVPAETSYEDVMALKPAGVFLSNGPGDPAATGVYAVPVIQKLLEADVPLFGICLGHQMLALAAGAKTVKMHQGHRGANHPVQRIGGGWAETEGLVEITSMNHGFAVDSETLPDTIHETHKSLFDGSNCGIEIIGKRAFGVQYHPEASPGPQDSFYLFEKFVGGLE
ncbi:glutamine-hydrolyzing carbamoyl-phosphate synthase small subunit [Sphingorhabdus sp. 109]|jgi:carbamoyl-phosphate synthase small subunit|uniref:glutamine-hydrolyzing carbamoyl-phosphate synthase small subunit n=1 Tax=Sphingorhabdus sp. 109 TaxID=2653173 RepID=UPI0012EF05D6|nr:glutamine-hydrolyzing carbamoyl-phosphate synthase small subunit [Sphingorhabdus sp. 109]VWX56851.1 carbamoyl phosphate synthetase small subunit, glutamine amidotransferase [Sphingorhabdus sp. 109]